MTLLAAPILDSTASVIGLSSGTVTLSSAPLVIVASSSPITQTLAVNVLGTQGTIVVTVTSGVFATGLYVFSTAGGGGAGSTAVNLPTVSAAGFAPVTSSAGLVTNLSSGTVSLSSQITVTSTSATNPWSSAPGFNLPVVSVSSGLIQLSSQISVTATGPVTVTSGIITLSSVHTIFSASSGGVQSFLPISPTSSVAGAGFGPVTSSAGVLASLSSGTVSLSSQITVTATGPVTVTSGLISVTSGTVTLSSNPTVITASSGFSSAALQVISTAGFAPVTSSAGLLVTMTSGVVTLSSQAGPWSSAPGFNVPVVTVSSGLVQISGVPFVTISSSSAIAPATIVATTISAISAGAGALYSLAAFTTGADGSILRLYNATTATVTMNTGVVAYFLVGNQTTAAAQIGQQVFGLDGRGMNFPTACSLDVVPTATSTLAVSGNAYVTFQFA